jgi:hypothetical protein
MAEALGANFRLRAKPSSHMELGTARGYEKSGFLWLKPSMRGKPSLGDSNYQRRRASAETN